MALVYPLDYLQDIVYKVLYIIPQLDANGNIIPNSKKYPLFSNQNILLQNQQYNIPNSNQYQSGDINPFWIRILTSSTNETLTRGNVFSPLDESIEYSTETIIRTMNTSFTFMVLSYMPPKSQLSSNSLFLDPNSAFYKWHSASNVIYDVLNSLLTSYAQNQMQIGKITIMNDPITSIRNLSFLEDGSQIQERFEFDINVVNTYYFKNNIDIYNQFNLMFTTDQ